MTTKVAVWSDKPSWLILEIEMSLGWQAVVFGHCKILIIISVVVSVCSVLSWTQETGEMATDD